jgi:hypothetical protein
MTSLPARGARPATPIALWLQVITPNAMAQSVYACRHRRELPAAARSDTIAVSA